MPRLRPSLLWKASQISPDLARLLPVCRDIPSALNELRWIRDHVQSLPAPETGRYHDRRHRHILVRHLCMRRGLGEPLQYLLGTQPFGDLDILCRPGVLIPRPETEAYTIHLADQIRSGVLPALGSPHDVINRGGLRILDICTGTGCIPLLLGSRLARRGLVSEVRGVDISPRALRLARDNTAHNGELLRNCEAQFQKLDVFAVEDAHTASSLAEDGSWDVVTCNPPYISEAGFARDTTRSVRNFEPRNANVPEERDLGGLYGTVRPEDVFYARVLDMCREQLRPRVVFFEVGDLEQAKRVAGMALRDHAQVEIWRDLPDVMPDSDDGFASISIDGVTVAAKGSGHGRGVLIHYHGGNGR
ncbi:hypothetical protein MCOR03_010986 [Pyricularia oryzae]|nr:hypothetical protein MCOR01_003167 [Pyricularia oryzae]KAI6333765.1 hypothetical protein MCOR30_004219 [Pyricularia oryzae]KAI6398285.1 hypothetical protein MCOR20_009289 [Pyricularia oryzae]KAI6425940.1 hypothetical protein MCOR21_006982 [Pyricularia oryzae]KAI6500553.1 hypothetical protein MCOR11_002709 [Pyricularia oryzae]